MSKTVFQIAFQHARENASVGGRLTNFLNQYGFCRNVAFVCLVSSIVLYAAYRGWDRPVAYLHWSWLAIGMAFAFRAAEMVHDRLPAFVSGAERDLHAQVRLLGHHVRFDRDGHCEIGRAHV